MRSWFATIPALLITSLLLLHMRPWTCQADEYDGHYDLRARDAAYLCVLMDDYLKTGRQPSLNQTSPEKLDRGMFTKGKPCWKFAWKPCDGVSYEERSQRPCGWYQMEKAPEAECN